MSVTETIMLGKLLIQFTIIKFNKLHYTRMLALHESSCKQLVDQNSKTGPKHWKWLASKILKRVADDIALQWYQLYY